MKTSTAIFLFVCIIFSSCKKSEQLPQNDTVELETQTDGRGNGNYDYEAVYSQVVSPDGQWAPLFKKYYNSSGKLNRMLVNFVDPAGGGLPAFYLNISYQNRKMIFLHENEDTALILNFDRSGRLISSKNWQWFLYGGDGGPETEPTFYRLYSYQYGRLRQINVGYIFYDSGSEDPVDPYDTTWSLETGIQYDWKKNPSKLIFHGTDGQPVHEISYQYNYSKKHNAQFYGDQKLPRFFYFLKYLNLFPELNPQHLLVSYERKTTEYPGDEKALYSNHKFDFRERLISYKSSFTRSGGSSGVEFWKISWHRNNQQDFCIGEK